MKCVFVCNQETDWDKWIKEYLLALINILLYWMPMYEMKYVITFTTYCIYYLRFHMYFKFYGVCVNKDII